MNDVFDSMSDEELKDYFEDLEAGYYIDMEKEGLI